MNTVYTQFQQALKREKQYITTYYDNIQYPCLYRKVDDCKNTNNHIEIFYDVATPINQGQLLIRGGKAFIVINKESVENDTYYKSTIKECNLTVPITIGGVLKQIPCYSYELSSAYTESNKVISIVDGNGEIITELIDELANTNYIGTGLRIMGGYYKVANMYNLDSIVHLMIERELTPPDEYSFTLTSDANSYIEGSTTQLTASASKNYTEDTTATITYSTSDEKIATVDSTGLVTFISIGNVIITATWTEQTLTDSVSLSVVADPNAPAYTFKLICSNPSNEITLGSSSYVTFTPTLMNGSTPVTFTPVWTFNYNGMSQSDFTITYDGILCKIKVAENYDIIGNTLRVICTTDDGKYSAFIDAMLVI